MIPGSANPLLLASATGAAAYEIERSLRFNSSDSAYCSRVPSTAGNKKTWTWAGWVKLSKLPTSSWGPYLFSCSESINSFIAIYYDGRPYVYHGDTGLYVECNRNLRDFSAWYHICVTYDTTQATASNRIKLYINGSQASFDGGTQPSLNYEATNGINSTNIHHIAKHWSSAGYTTDACLADIHFIDGQALDPTSFGYTDSNGIWQPKAYTGTYPGNSFHLDFADNSAATTAGIGKDVSGNGNDWTPVNLSASDAYILLPVPSVAPTNPSEAWDGITTTYAYGPSATTWTFNTPIPLPAARFDLLARSGWTWTASTNLGNVTLTNNGTWPGSPGSYPGWYSYSNASLTTVYSISVNATANNWTLSGMQIAGNPSVVGTQLLVFGPQVSSDSLVDTPTNYGIDTGVGSEVRGNYATWNPNNYSSSFFSDGNLKFAPTTGYNETAKATMAIGDKCYFEVTILSPNTAQNYLAIGLMRQETQVLLGSTTGYNIPVGASGNYTGSVAYRPYGGTVNYNGSSVVTGLSTCTVGDVVGISYDPSNGQVKVYKNGVALNSGNAVYTLSTAYSYAPAMTEAASNAYYVNFGQRPFAYTAPSGYKALCTTNLPAPTIADGSTVMDVKLYAGNGSTQTISGLGFSPDLVWVKSRSQAFNHGLYDTVRGVTKRLISSSTNAEDTLSGVTAFNSDGFEMGGADGTNGSTYTYAAWTWDAGSSTVSNNDGSITSQVRANASAGFSIVTYTGTGSNATVGHGLGVAPSLIIVKARNAARNWPVYHASTGASAYTYLDGAFATVTGNAVMWQGVAPTSTVFSVGTYAENNGAYNYVAYCFAPVAGYSAFGSYTGNGSADGPFVYTGFRPRWLMIKRSSSSGYNWQIHDTERIAYNVNTKALFANASDSEYTFSSAVFDMLSNGFKARGSDSYVNASGETYIYATFAESPFQYSRAR